MNWTTKNGAPKYSIISFTILTTKDVLTIFYNTTKHKKIYFEVHQMPNPKFQMEITPSSGVIKKGEGVEITFKVRAFVTTCVFQLVRINLSLAKFATGTARKVVPS